MNHEQSEIGSCLKEITQCTGTQGWQVSAISGLNLRLNRHGRNRLLPLFLPKHNKCSNILDKSTHFFAEQTKGHHLLSIQPG